MIRARATAMSRAEARATAMSRAEARAVAHTHAEAEAKAVTDGRRSPHVNIELGWTLTLAESA